MLTSLRLINYRSHSNTVVELRPLNLFIGPVAAGKSNIFKARCTSPTGRERPSDMNGQQVFSKACET